jgi:hypothetical protein
MLHHEVDNVAMTDAELEDFLSFMDQPPGGGAGGVPLACAPCVGALAAGPLGALCANGGAAALGLCGGGAATAPTSSSEAPGSSGDHHDSRMRSAEHDCQRSPGSSDDCGSGGGAPPGHGRPSPSPGLGRLPEGEAFPPAGMGMAVPVPMPMPVARAASAAELGAAAAAARGGVHPELLRAHSVASLGSLTTPLEGLALGSPAVHGGLAVADAGGSGHGMMMFAGHGHHGGGMPPAFRGAFHAGPHGGGGMVSMGAFGAPHPAGFVPSGPGMAGSAPPCAVSLASTLDGCGDPTAAYAVGSAPGAGAPLSTSWPSVGAAPLSTSAGGGPPARSRSGGVSKPPSSGRAGSRGRGGAAAGGDATYHRSNSGGGTLSHSTIEKQRRDRLNGLLDELGAMVPPSDGRGEGGRRPKHVILSDAIALLGSLQEQLRLGVDEISALRMRLAAAETGAAGAGAGAAGAGAAGAAAAAVPGGIDIAARGGSASGSAPGGCGLARPEPSSSAETAACLLPPTPVCTSPADALPGMLRCASSDADLSLPPLAGGAPGGGGPPATVSVEQEGSSLRVSVSCHDRDGLLSDLVAALKATGATIAKASITTNRDGTARDDFELRLHAGGPLRIEDVRAAVLSVLGAGAGVAAAGARGKRTRQ